MGFLDKVVLVTGGCSGLGAATALAFARSNAKVAIVDRNKAKVATIVDSFAGLSPPLVISADIADDKQAATIVDRTVEHFGKLDVLVNNAGIIRAASVLEGDLLEAYDEIMATNLRAAIHIAVKAAPELIKTKGNVINISSAAALRVMPMTAMMPYSVSKAGLTYFTKSMALELAPHGVRVNTVTPGPVVTDILKNTDMKISWDDFITISPLKKIGDVKEIAELVLFLASDKAKGITGANYVSDNGILLK